MPRLGELAALACRFSGTVFMKWDGVPEGMDARRCQDFLSSSSYCPEFEFEPGKIAGDMERQAP
jgi:hypothetical protein